MVGGQVTRLGAGARVDGGIAREGTGGIFQ